MLASGEDFTKEDLQGVCEEEGVAFAADDDGVNDMAKALQDHLVAQLAAVTRSEYREMIALMGLDDAREVAEEEGIDTAGDEASLEELRVLLTAHFCTPPEAEEPAAPDVPMTPRLEPEPEPEPEPEEAWYHVPLPTDSFAQKASPAVSSQAILQLLVTRVDLR